MPETPKKPSKTAIERSQRSEATQVTPKPRKKPGPPKGSGGRPSTYDPVVAQQMCEMLSDGIPLQEICRKPGFPPWRTVYHWMEANPELAASIARAREIGYDALAEQCLIISNTPLFGQVVTDDGERVTVKKEDMLGHRKLQIETRLKLLAKWDPKRFGDRVQLAGDSENPLKVSQTVEVKTMFDAILQNMELKRQSDANE